MAINWMLSYSWVIFIYFQQEMFWFCPTNTAGLGSDLETCLMYLKTGGLAMIMGRGRSFQSFDGGEGPDLNTKC